MLKIGDTGPFGELMAKENPEGLVVFYIPGIEPMLNRAEELKGMSLSDSEIERIRNGAPAIAASREVATATIKDRGFE